MATQIIDTTINGSSFPATYIGAGTLIGNVRRSSDVVNDIYGYFTAAGNAVQINLGYRPLEIEVLDLTGVIQWSWLYGMPATNSLKGVAAGTLTVDTTSAIVVSEPNPAANNSGNYIVTLSAALCVSTHLILFYING